MTTRREFLGGAAVASIVATLPSARAAGQVRPNPPTSLLVDGRSNTASDNGYYADPYSGYATWYVNGTTGVNTPNPGVDRRPAGFVYRNYENALLDVFYAGNPGLRRIVVQAGTYAPLSSVLGGYFPAGGPDAAHPCVIQGEASLTAPPIIDGGLSSWPAFCVGSRGGFNTAQINLGNIVIRKLEIRNFTCPSVYFYWGSSTNITIEYCNFHSNRYPAANPSASGAIAVTSANCLSGLNVRHCKFSDFRTLAGGYQLNCVPFETYGSSNVTFQNCLFQGAYAAIRMKLLEKDSHGFGRADNFRILNNIFANCYAAISVGTGSTVYLANSNWVIAGNLVYGPPLNVGGGTAALAWVNAGYVDSSAGLGQGISWTNNTIAEDVSSGFGWIGASGITVLDNICLANRHFYSTSAAMGAANADLFSVIDHNVYGGGTRWNLGWRQDLYAFDYQYNDFAQWKAAYTKPLTASGAAASKPPPDFQSLFGSRDPDPNGLWIPDLSPPFNTVGGNFQNSASRDYTLASGSPLLRASSTAGRVGYDPTNSGPGW